MTLFGSGPIGGLPEFELKNDSGAIREIIKSIIKDHDPEGGYSLFAVHSGVRTNVCSVTYLGAGVYSILRIKGVEGQTIFGYESQFVFSYEKSPETHKIGFHTSGFTTPGGE